MLIILVSAYLEFVITHTHVCIIITHTCRVYS